MAPDASTVRAKTGCAVWKVRRTIAIEMTPIRDMSGLVPACQSTTACTQLSQPQGSTIKATAEGMLDGLEGRLATNAVPGKMEALGGPRPWPYR